MTAWLEETPTTTCPSCGVDCTPWRRPVDLDWRDDNERESGHLAVALTAHRYAVHRVQVAVGDLVRYWSPWRGLILGSDIYRVEHIRDTADFHDYARKCGADVDQMIGTSYTLVNPHRRNDRCFPFTGDPDRPIVFETVESAPPAEVDLMDLLEWDAA